MFSINDALIGAGQTTYVIAEMSGNHNQSFDQAVKIIEAAKEAGANAVKIQTYTADTLTIQSSKDYFKIKGGTLWDGKTLYDLYKEAATPWEWQPKLKDAADKIGIDLFSSPFDATAVDFLEKMNVPAYKIASFEIVDIPLIERVAQTGKPIIFSTGMSSLEDIQDAISAAKKYNNSNIALLKCTSAYPAPFEDAHLKTIPDMINRFQMPIGISDHTMGIEVPIAAVSLGACIVEKHFTLSRSLPGPDSAFSLEPQELKSMVTAIRNIEKAIGSTFYGINKHEEKSKIFRRSLFIVKDLNAGEVVTSEHVRSIRPGYGIKPKHLKEVIGKRALKNIEKGTPLSWNLIGD